MSDPRSSSPSPPPLPWLLRAVVGLFRASASLQLAVTLIVLYIVVLVWATTVMSYWYADPELKYGIYNSWWFLLLNALLALNVLNAALVRFPWRRRQAGFLATHSGIIVLLVGSLVSYRGGVDANLVVYEHQANHLAFQDQNHFKLFVVENANSPAGRPEPIDIPFRAGPFNWDDYGTELWWFPWGIAGHDSGVLYDRDGIRLEVLDYYRDSVRKGTPRVTLRLRPDGRQSVTAMRGAAEEVTLAVTPAPHQAAGRPFGAGSHEVARQTGHVFNFWMTAGKDETEAFLQSQPEDDLGRQGQLVLYHAGLPHRFRIDELSPGDRLPIGDVEVEFLGVMPRVMGMPIPAVQLAVRDQGESAERLTLYASLPFWNVHDRRHGVYGTYWLGSNDPTQEGEGESHEMASRIRRDARAPRIDLLQGHDQKLYYRTWQTWGACAAGLWPTGEKGRQPLSAFAESEDAVSVELVEHAAAAEPGWEILSRPYVRNPPRGHTRQPRAKVRLSVDGNAEEFWLAGPGSQRTDDQERVVRGDGRRVFIGMPQNVVELGFEVYLRQFEQKLDPGARRSAHFSSLVDFRESGEQKGDEPRVLRGNTLIALNAPVDFVDPKSKRSYRLFQSEFRPPAKPGDEMYDRLVRPHENRPKLYASIFSVNHDPGRALKYAGSLLICVGITMVYYVKVRSRRRVLAARSTPTSSV